MMLTAHSIGNARIAALGMMSFVRYPERSGRDLFADAGLTPNVDDELYYRNFVSTLSENQDYQGPLMSEVIGTTTPAKRIEGACALSGLAVRDTRDETTRVGPSPSTSRGLKAKEYPVGTTPTAAICVTPVAPTTHCYGCLLEL